MKIYNLIFKFFACIFFFNIVMKMKNDIVMKMKNPSHQFFYLILKLILI